MIQTAVTSLVLCLVPALQSDERTLTRVSQSAQRQLEKSVQELDELRSAIQAEKLPLAEELTTLEEKLSQLRREHDRVARLVDEGNLALGTIRTNIQKRQDNLTYVGNLLDEYARNFETKVGVGELQTCGEAIEAAKSAPENPTLSLQEKLALQTVLVEISIQRLFHAMSGLRFPGQGVDLLGAVADGQFALIGPVSVFHGKSETSTGIAVAQTGSALPLIRPLDGALQSGIAALVTSGQGFLPLDASRGGALEALVQKTNLFHIFEKGGPIMWPLLIASIVALGTVLERFLFLARERLKRDNEALDAFFKAVTEGDLDEAAKVSKGSKFFVLRALGYALVHKEQSLANALLYSTAQEMKRFGRGIPILDTVITLAPLLGLLGTVTGMMGSFSLIGGELSAPGAITGGIAEALIATAFGLGIAITALLPFNYLNARTEDARHELESAAAQLELLVSRNRLEADVVVAPAVDAGRRHAAGERSDERREAVQRA
jgi:biopolymer transport protein ExbB